LKDIQLPLEMPIIPDQAQFFVAVDRKRKKSMSQLAVACIFLAAATVFSVVAVYALRQMELDLKPSQD